MEKEEAIESNLKQDEKMQRSKHNSREKGRTEDRLGARTHLGRDCFKDGKQFGDLL